MKALQILIFLTILSSTLAGADVGEIAALVNIRNHVPGLDTVWTDQRLEQTCNTYLDYISCVGSHVTEM